MNDTALSKNEKRAFGASIAGAVFCLDQSMKYLLSDSSRRYCNPEGVLGAVSHEGILVFGGVALLGMFGILLLQAGTWKEIVVLALFFGGGLSNLLDRVIHGCVRDFTILSWFPALNFADLALSLGVILFFVLLIVRKEET